MRLLKTITPFLFSLLVFFEAASAQEVLSADTSVIIKDIVLIGNKRTKEQVIFREMHLKKGDTIPAAKLDTLVSQSRQQLLNTGLFSEADITITPLDPKYITLTIVLEERWYIFPLPVVKLAEGLDLNEWANKYNYSLSKTSYGAYLYHRNVRGRNERLKLAFQAGYTQRLELEYRIPYINKAQTLGIELTTGYNTNKQIILQTIKDTLNFFSIPDRTQALRKLHHAGVIFSYRKKIHDIHFLELIYNKNRIDSIVAALNPQYFLDKETGLSETLQEYISIKYEYINDHRDIKAYPLHGYFFGLEVEKEGIGIFKHDINLYEFTSNFDKFWRLTPKNYFSASVKAKATYPEIQPYFNQRALGYGNDIVRGFENYVVDGQKFVLLKSTLKHKFFDIQKYKSHLPGKLKKLPLALYIKAFGDYAYVENTNVEMLKTNTLPNRSLLGGGPGIDLVTFYDLAIRFEYAFTNKFRDSDSAYERGFFIHFSSEM